MKRNNLTRLIIVILLVLWSLYEIYPPGTRDLVEWFGTRAHSKDAAFTGILTQAQELQKQNPRRSYGNLLDAIGTNDIIHYFPSFQAQDDPNPTAYILNRLQRESMGKIHLGIDLQGGISFSLEMDTNALFSIQQDTNKVSRADAASAALSQAVEVLRKRVDKFGVAEPVILPEGDNRIVVQLPGLSEESRSNAVSTLSRPAYLEFKLVHENSAALLKQGVIEPGYEVLIKMEEGKDGQKIPTKYLVKRRAEMVGGIKSAGVSRDNMGNPEILFTLDSEHAEQFAQITRDNVGHQLAIVLDHQLQTAPNIRTAIEGGSGEITGNYTDQEAFQLANVLENPLKAPLHIISSSEVDPTLGKDSISSGIHAALIGVLLVAGFMLCYYMLAGAVANMALMLNIIILLGVMCSVGTTLTMPGIAGVVLTVGMAVDANVLIFERIREESGKGKSLRGALQAGYDRAFGTIFDSHVTTLISSIILIFMGTGSVKGFGVTLTIGVAASLFTALVVTRLIFDWLLAKNILKQIKMLHLIKNTKIDFMRWAVPAFIASWMLILVGMSYGIFVRGHDVLGVEFAGGETITLGFDPAHKVDVDKLRKAAVAASSGDVLVGYQHDIAGSSETLQVTVRDFNVQAGAANPSDKVIAALQQEYPDSNFIVKGADRVGATVSGDIARAAVLASLLAMFGILIYVAFRYEFSFAVGAVVAIIHDVFMTLGCYFLFGRELNATTVAAVLTIIGFSINDTIVIFDRIREDLKLGVRGSFKEIVNQALNQTLSRTLITSGTVFLATLSLFLFGGGVINDFAFAFLVGILTGTYSSIYIASALVLWWHKGQRRAWARPRKSLCPTPALWSRANSSADMLALVQITPWHWVGFIGFVLVCLALDLGVFHRGAYEVKFKSALVWTLIWCSLAMLFALALAQWRSKHEALEFLTGYVIEFSLSMDNVFVIALIFTYFRVPAKYQHRVLFWGILGALVMRGLMIVGGAELVGRFQWTLYLFGGFLVFTGIKMLFAGEGELHPEKNPVLRVARKLFPVSPEMDGHKLLTLVNGRRALTPLMIVLLTVETSDLIFALDSIPAIFSVTTKPFIVFTSNVFAILGLRSLYFLLVGAINYFRYLKVGLSLVLVFIGIKMLIDPHDAPKPLWFQVDIPTGVSLMTVGTIILIAIVLSVMVTEREKRTGVKKN